MGRDVLALIAMLSITVVAACAPPVASTVPAIGCSANGQTGPLPVQNPDRVRLLTGAEANGLAYYEAVGLGVLAPIGWHCFGLYGSNGSILIVTPDQHAEDLLTSEGRLQGPAVQLTVAFGGTSGRFEAAEIAARLFPSRRNYVEGVMAEGLEPQSSFHFGPFPTDNIRRLGDDVVEFETPPTMLGMGSKLVVRVPKGQRELVATIINTVRESKKSFALE